jgi:hypothetical protein
MKYHLLTSDGTEVAVADGLLTEGLTVVIPGPAEGEEPLVIHRVAVEDPSGELQDALANGLSLPIAVAAPITLILTLNLEVVT